MKVTSIPTSTSSSGKLTICEDRAAQADLARGTPSQYVIEEEEEGGGSHFKLKKRMIPERLSEGALSSPTVMIPGNILEELFHGSSERGAAVLVIGIDCSFPCLSGGTRKEHGCILRGLWLLAYDQDYG